MKKNNIFKLFLTFLKIGAFTFGGGYAMIAVLESEIVEHKKWLSKDEFLDMVAVAESTPGPIAINSATYIGYKTGKLIGAAAATLGVVLPSFFVIFVISLFFDKFLQFKYVTYAFKGIQSCIVYLILSAGLKMFKSIEKNTMEMTIVFVVIAVMTALSIFSVNFSSIVLILMSGFAGLGVYFLNRKKDEIVSKERKK